MIEVIVKDHELQIYVNRKELAEWLAGKGGVPWDGDPNSTDDLPGDSTDDKQDSGSSTDASEPEGQGYRTADGTQKEFPNPADVPSQEKDPKQENGINQLPSDGVNLFDEGPTGQKGTLQDAPRDWMKKNKFNYRNFCQFLYDMKEVGGFKLSTPLIGVTKSSKEPTLLQVAYRFYSFWKAGHEDIGRQYKRYLLKQLEDMGVKIELVKDALEGEEIDPKKLPKGFEVSV
jgi:hypothetical protein